MITPIKVEDAVERLLDEGLHPSTIRGTLSLVTEGYVLTKLDAIVAEQTTRWLEAAEVRMANYAKEGSWTRLSKLLATYRRVTGP